MEKIIQVLKSYQNEIMNEINFKEQNEDPDKSELLKKLVNVNEAIQEAYDIIGSVVIDFKETKRRLSSQIDLIENNSEMYPFLTTRERVFIAKDFRDRFESVLKEKE